ncbi:MAG TPA: porin [Rhizomicrobium sp.]|jgi:hypothetical protein
MGNTGWLQAGAFLSGLACTQALADAAPDPGAIEPLKFNLLGFIGTVGGDASGAVYTARQSGGIHTTGLTAGAWVEPNLETVFDNAWELGFKGDFLVYHDKLTGDNYGNDVVEKAYAYLQTLYGRFEIGQQDGAAYKFVLNGPDIDDLAAINDSNLTFFKDKSSGAALNGIFNLRTGVFDSANDAKISYYIPHFFDLQIGISYTPYMAKGGLPWIDQGHHVANRPENIWEVGANYAGYFGQYVVRGYGGFAMAENASPTPGHDALRDYGLALQIDHPFAGGQFSAGGGWRRSNAYTFDVTQPFTHGDTSDWRLGSTYTKGDWSFGLEYDRGAADAHPGLPALTESGAEASLGYQLTPNLQLTAGYEHMHFARGAGTFYNGQSDVNADAAFLHTQVHI